MNECTEITFDKKIPFAEKGMTLMLINRDCVKSEKIEVDGCALKNNQPKCDYMHKAKSIERYIELKGKDINHAIKQIISTIEQLSSDKRNCEKISYIICSQSPKVSTNRQILERKLRENYKSKVVVKSVYYEEVF